MSYEFLAGYHIPIIQPEVVMATAPPPPFPPEEQRETVNIHNQYQNINRYIPPGLQGTKYESSPISRPQKRKYDAGPGIIAKEASNEESSSNGKLVMFQGRDESYPDELNKLIHPLHCALCVVQMNSSKSARDHYQSKQHDRLITHWLKINYTDNGLPAPTVKRFIKETPSGANTLRCDLCDLKFSSLVHSSQHFAGRRHKLVANKISHPSGSGYYNTENKWVRIGTKYVPNDKDGRFGIGELFKNQQNVKDGVTTDEATAPTVKNPVDIQTVSAIETAEPVPTSLYCETCKVTATSELQMTMHLQGIKHKKKLKTLGLDGTLEKKLTPANTVNGEVTILESLQQSNTNLDLSMYRTPSGAYYCECCNMLMCHLAALQQHLVGKKHLKKISDAKEKSKLN